MPTASTTTSSKRSISRGRSSKAASVRIGEFSTLHVIRSSIGQEPITDPDHWRLAAIAILVSVLLSLPLLAMSAVTSWQTAMLAGAANVVGAWFAAVFGYWNGHYFVPGAAFALGLGMILLCR